MATGKYNYRKRKTTTTKPRRKYKTRAQASSKMVKSIVKKEIARQAENKEVCAADNYVEIYQSGTNTITGNTVYTLTPIIAQSTGENGRVGNSVKLKKLILRGYMSVYPQNTLNVLVNSQIPEQVGQWNVRLFIGRMKNSINAPTTADFQQLLRVGGSTYPFDSALMLSLCRTVNTELFTVYYDKIHKIGMQNGTNTQVSLGIHNNDFKLAKFLKIDCTKFMRKNLIFNDNNNLPTNASLFLWAGLVDSLGSGYLSNDALVNFTHDLEFSYEDM